MIRSSKGASRAAAVMAMSLLMLAGCDAPPEPPPAAEPPAQDQLTVEPSPAPAPQAGAEQGPAPFYVGRWAAAETACGHAHWTITEDGLQTSGALSCRFDMVNDVPAGVEIEATCAEAGPPEPVRIRFAYAQSADALLVEAPPFASVGLIACETPTN